MESLTLYERETVMLYNQAERTASIDTCDPVLIRRLDEFMEKSTEISLLSEDEYGKRYLIPKKWIKINLPRQLTDEQRQELSEKMRQKNADRQ